MLKIEVTQGDIDLTKEVVTSKTILGGQIEIAFKNNKGCEPFVSFDGNYRLCQCGHDCEKDSIARKLYDRFSFINGHCLASYVKNDAADLTALEKWLTEIKTKTERVKNNDR